MRHAEELNEGLAFFHFLLGDAESGSCLVEAQRQSTSCALDHAAFPLLRVQPFVLLEDSLAA